MIILRETSLFYTSELSGAGREISPSIVANRSKSAAGSSNRAKLSQIFLKPRVSFFLTRITPLWYNTKGGEGKTLPKQARPRVHG